MPEAAATTDNWQDWSTGRLGVGSDAPAQELQAAILARLEDDELAPAGQENAAIRLGLAKLQSSDPPPRVLREFARAQRQVLAEEVEEFARQYWSLAPGNRQHKHAQLWTAAASAPLIRLRLDSLRDGLRAIAVTPVDANPIDELAVKVQDCYVLPALARAVRRHELAESIRSAEDESYSLLRLEEDYPHLRRLEPHLNIEAVARPVRNNLVGLRRLHEVKPSPQNESTGWGGGRTLWLAIVVVSGLIRLGSSISSHSGYTPVPHEPLRSIQAPRFPTQPAPSKTRDELYELIKASSNDNSEKAKNSLEKVPGKPE